VVTKMRSRQPSHAHSELGFNILNTVMLSLLLIVVLYPLLYVLSASFSSGYAISSGRVWLWPVEFTLSSYQSVFRDPQVANGFYNSFFYMIVGTSLNVSITLLAAYPLSRSDFKWNRFFMFLVLFTMLFDGGIIPRYILVKNLSLLDTRWAIILPSAMAAWDVLITRTYFKMNLPDELLEASRMDGCSDFRFFARIALPLSLPIIAVIGLFYAVMQWNQFFNAMIYLNSKSLFPLQLVLNEILIRNNISGMMVLDVETQAKINELAEQLKYALIVIASLPLLVLYPFVQRFFIKGVLIGSIKG